MRPTILIWLLNPFEAATRPSLPAVDLIESPNCANLSRYKRRQWIRGVEGVVVMIDGWGKVFTFASM